MGTPKLPTYHVVIDTLRGKFMSLTDEQIREVFLANGFTIKEGNTDLKPYVYAAARALLASQPVAGNQKPWAYAIIRHGKVQYVERSQEQADRWLNAEVIPLAPICVSQPVAAAQPQYTGWYCAHCQRGVDSSEVTFHEQHQECGRVITNDRPPAQPTPVVSERGEFEQWKDDYGLIHEPNYSAHTEADCLAAFRAGRALSAPEAQQPSEWNAAIEAAGKTVEEFKFEGYYKGISARLQAAFLRRIRSLRRPAAQEADKSCPRGCGGTSRTAPAAPRMPTRENCNERRHQ